VGGVQLPAWESGVQAGGVAAQDLDVDVEVVADPVAAKQFDRHSAGHPPGPVERGEHRGQPRWFQRGPASDAHRPWSLGV